MCVLANDVGPVQTYCRSGVHAVSAWEKRSSIALKCGLSNLSSLKAGERDPHSEWNMDRL